MSEFGQDQRHQRAWLTDGMLHVSSVPQRALIRVLAIAHERNLDAPTLVSCLAGEFPGTSAQQLNQLSNALAEGVPVVDALTQTPGVLDRSTVIALRLASQSGSLPGMYDALLDDGESFAAEVGSGDRNLGADFVQITFSALFAFLLISFLMLFVMPTFEQIFEEFGVRLPAPMLALIAVCHWFANYWFLVALVGIVLGAAFMASRGAAIAQLLTPSAWGKRLISPSANLVSLLSIAAQSGQPLASSLSTIARCHHHPRTRRRLANACDRMERGEEPWSSLAAEKLLSKRDARALSVSESGETQGWLLSWAAQGRQNRSTSRAYLLVRSVSIMCTLALGLIVAWTAVSVFASLYSLVSGLS